MKIATLQLVVVLLLCACADKPKPLPEFKAVRIQNEETKKRIDTFTEHNERTQKETKRASDAQKLETQAIIKGSTALETARKMLKKLLAEDDKE